MTTNVTKLTVQKASGAWIHLSGSADVNVVNTEKKITFLIELDSRREIDDDKNPCVSVFPHNIVSARDLNYKAMAAPGESTVADNVLKIVAVVKAGGNPHNTVVSVGFTAAIPFKA